MKKIFKWLLILVVVATILAPVISNGRSVGDILDNIKDTDVKDSSTLVGDDTPVVDSHLAAAGWQLFFTFESDDNGVLNSNCEEPGVYSFKNHNQGEYYFVFKENYYDPYKVTGAYVTSYNYNRFMFKTEHVSSVDIKPIVEINGKIIPNTIYCAVYYDASGDNTSGDVTEEYLTFTISGQELKYLEGMTTWKEVAEINEGFYINPDLMDGILYQGRLFVDDVEEPVYWWSDFKPVAYFAVGDELDCFYVNDIPFYFGDSIDVIFEIWKSFIIDDDGYVFFEEKALLLDGERVTAETFSYDQRYVTSDDIIYTPPEELEFAISGYEPFVYEEGMTWYDIFDIYVDFSESEEGYVCYDGWILEYSNGEKVRSADVFNGGYFTYSEQVDTEKEPEILQFTVDIMTFYFEDTMTFYFEEGMDWVDFVNSDYNVLPDSSVVAFSICDDDVLHVHYNSDDSAVYDEEFNLIEFDSLIDPFVSYQLGENPHG